jgi:hypothetical protein
MFFNIIDWFVLSRKGKAMANPLILTLEEFTARQAEFADYDKSLSMACVETMEPKAFTARTRKIITDELGKINHYGSSQGEDSLPQAAVWGPTVKSSDVATIYFRLVPQGTEGQYDSTDGMDVKPPPLPAIQRAIEAQIPMHPSLMPTNGAAHVDTLLHGRVRIAPDPPQGKLYRVSEPVEVTPEQVQEEMGRKRKNGKPIIYIRGEIVAPKLRVEI